jgi:hypothetical protein
MSGTNRKPDPSMSILECIGAILQGSILGALIFPIGIFVGFIGAKMALWLRGFL